MALATSAEISVSLLHISTENPRFDPTADQSESISLILEDQAQKIANLAENIVEFGLNPSELTIVSPSKSEKGFFNVLEGNRRLTALKLLENPNLALPKFKDVCVKFKHLSKNYKEVKKIRCVIFDDPEEANHWIKLKHTGENDGVGTVRWDSQQIARFEASSGGTSSIALQAIDFLKNSQYVDSALKARLAKVPLTNLDRLLADKGIQELLGISVRKKRLNSEVSELELVKGLSKIIEDLVSKKVKVKDIYTKKDRGQYLESFKKSEVPQKSKEPDEAWELLPESVPKKGVTNTRRSVPLSTSRKTLIPKNFIIKINEKRINKIYSELKSLDCDEFNNAASVLLRVFLELSADAYLGKHKIRSLSSNSELNKKLSGIAEEFEKNNVLAIDELKGIRTTTSSHNSIFSTTSFHAYVHNKSFNPISNDLKTTWDNIQLFMEKVWERLQ